MDLGDRKCFFSELDRSLNEGYDSPFNGKSSGSRLRKAIGALPILWWGECAWWWNGTRYVELFHKELRAAISWCFDRVDAYASTKLVKDLALQVRYRLESREVEQSDPFILSFRNGMVDMGLQRLSLQPHSSRRFVRRWLDFDYDMGAKCPQWSAFLSEVLPDKDCRKVLQEFIGAIFLDRKQYKIETMLWLYGGGANGKSVVFDVLMGLLGGPENVTTRDMRELCHPSHGRFALSDLDGKLLNYCSDVQGEFTFTDQAKKLISGEPTHAERKFEQARLITRIPLFMANTNTLPKLGDNTNSWARRVKIIPFYVTIAEARQDHTLARKILETEKEGIFAWIMEGRRRFLAQGCRFSQAQECDRLMYSYRNGGYDIPDFMTFEGFTSVRQYFGDDGKSVLVRDLYGVFLSWLEVENAPETSQMSQATFRKRLKQNGYIPYKRRDGTAVRVFSVQSASTQAKRRKRIETDTALQIEPLPIESAPAEEGDILHRGDVLERMKRQLEDRL